MEFYTIASSSAGNAALVCHEDTHILIDAGVSCRRITQSLAALDLTLEDIDAILITHEHIDHVRALGTLQKKCAVPLYASRGTAAALDYPAERVHAFAPGDAFTVGSLRALPFRTSHDARESVGYRIESGDGSLAVLTDTGFITDDARPVPTPIRSSGASSANTGTCPTRRQRSLPSNVSAPARATFCSRT